MAVQAVPTKGNLMNTKKSLALAKNGYEPVSYTHLSITGIYEYGCELFKKRMECAIMMKVAEAEL